MKHIIVNKIKTPDGTILESKNSKKFVSHTDKNGELYFIDGGINSIIGQSINKIEATNMYIYAEDDISLIREHFSWGTFGKDGKQTLKYILLKDIESNHIKAILKTQDLKDHILEIFKREVKLRTK